MRNTEKKQTTLQEKREQTSLKDYAEAWNGHISDLGRLSWNLTHEQHTELKEIQNKLSVLVVEATADLKRKRAKDE